ncbi:alpha/beta hydrolase [Sphaerimonospora cavernae]|uniref:Alpha/beta hydrolase n=1 Tax=Sphaerimonospora cavernae TaxID=1740611 RepID=A0ABV6U2T9_9ACTN
MDPERVVDPDELEKLAKQLTDRQQLAEEYYKRACQFMGQPGANQLVTVLKWATDTAGDLRDRAQISRAADKGGDPFGALSTFGLTTAISKVSGQDRTRLENDLKALIADNAKAGPEQRAQAIREFFGKLTAAERSWLAIERPEVVGRLDGAPATVRYAANRLLIERALAHEQRNLAELKAGIPKKPRVESLIEHGLVNDPRFASLFERALGDGPQMALLLGQASVYSPQMAQKIRQALARDPEISRKIERALDDDPQMAQRLERAIPQDPRVSQLEQRVARMSELLQPRVTGDNQLKQRQFLLFDPADDGRVAEVFGDLAKAKHVAVMVPGITNRLDNYDDIANDAENLLADRMTGKDLPETAVITWLGYDTPEFGDSVLPAKAEAGAPALHSFRAGLDAAKGAKFALFAHSYGTLLSSKALQQGASFDSVVFMGSPGLGPNVKSAADLKLTAGTQVFAMRAPADWVSYTEAHGYDPADMPDIQRLATGASSGHSKYYIPKNTGLDNLQTVLTGDAYVRPFTGSPRVDDEQFGASGVRVLVKELQSRVPQWKTGELAAALDPVIKSALAGETDQKAVINQAMHELRKSELGGYLSAADITEITAKALAAAGAPLAERAILFTATRGAYPR